MLPAPPPALGRLRLDSTDPKSTWPTPSVVPSHLLRCDAGGTALYTPAGVVRRWPDPLDALAWMADTITAEPPGSRWVGSLGYDLGRRFEAIPTRAADDVNLPAFAFGLCRGGDSCADETGHPSAGTIVSSTFTRPAYEAAVARAVEYVRAGDVFQVNLSQRFTVATSATPAAVYARLHGRTPAAYGACLDFGDFALLCNSPELFLRVTPGGRVVTRPIKGTRPRRPGMAAELLASEKDAAELNMIVDLERNDLGRVCTVGSVRVTQPRTVEPHPTVYHGVATVEGQLRPGVTFVDLLRATFPGGSVTGAPKVRAMQIIDELEPVRRGPYCGAIGYLDADGSMQFNVAIRTIAMKDGLAHVAVGGGVVADSDPAAEYEETLVKARATFAALNAALR